MMQMSATLMAISSIVSASKLIRETVIYRERDETLKVAPNFDPDDRPDFADRSWGGRVHSYYVYHTNLNR